MADTVLGTLLILGASGDLTSRLLLPGLATLQASERGRPLKLVGAGMEDFTPAQWKTRVRKAFRSAKVSGDLVERTERDTEYVAGDVTDPAMLRHLLDRCEGVPAIYFALPPAVTAKVCEALREVDLPEGTNLVLEKPFGVDLPTAQKLNRLLNTLVPENQVHRVDHFLGRADVLNILGTRFANRMLEPVWNNQHVERIDVVFDEDLTLEGRAGYYDHAGALVDMLQSHLLQVMALLMMDPPTALDEGDLRNGKVTVLRATHVWEDDPVASSRRARYTAGKIGRRDVPAYTKEPGVDPARGTETLAEVTFEVATWRWAGVPVTLRSGKSLGRPRKEIVVTFKPPPHLPRGFAGTDRPEQVRIGLSPARLVLGMDVNGPGDPFQLDWVQLEADLGPGDLEAYGEVLGGVMDADPTLSVRGDAAEQCWRILAPVRKAWASGAVPMQTYKAGSDGPTAWRTSREAAASREPATSARP
ncbi:MAG: glucose-6-phosphate dehydrogenase [Marmoricola sp.]